MGFDDPRKELLDELEPDAVKEMVEKEPRALRFSSFNESLRDWIIDAWRSCGKWPLSHPPGKYISGLTAGSSLFRLAGFIGQGLKIEYTHLLVLRKILGRLSGGKRPEFYRAFRYFYLLMRARRGFVQSLDMYPIFCRHRPLQRLFGWRPSRWRRVTSGFIKLSEGKGRKKVLLSCDHLSCSLDYWNGCGNLRLRWLDRLIDFQAEELRVIRDFCKEVSRKSRKIVLSWHNATLGAIGGWAFSPTVASVLSGLKKKADLRTLWERNIKLCKSDEELGEALRLFESRIVIPAVRFYIWLEAQCRKIIPEKKPLLERCLNKLCRCSPEWEWIREKLTPDETSASYPFPPLSGDLLKGLRFLGWFEKQRKLWIRGWALYDSLIELGYELLDRREKEHIVLPRIDKFFISTRRTGDVEYLALLVRRLVRRHGDRILLLLWDDTVHASCPSLYLAIRKLLDLGASARGLGIFANGKEGNDPEPDDVVKDSERYKVFILRPYERTLKGAFGEFFHQSDHSFFQSYSPAWRDGLSFIYSGTAIENFLSLPISSGEYASWVICNGKKIPFGVWFRAILRKRIGVSDRFAVGLEGFGDVDKCYARWANLE